MIIFGKWDATPVQYDILKKSSIGNRSLEDLTWSIPMPAHIKDATNGKYIISNQKNLEVYGLSKIEDILGKNVEDLNSFMRPHWGENFAKKIVESDLQVGKNNKMAQLVNTILIDSNNFIHIQDITKIPVTQNNKVVAIFTYTHDKTSTIDLIELFNIYKKVYIKPSRVSELFTQYLNLTNIFIEPLSCTELTILLHAKTCNSRNELAQKLFRSVKTIETHITNINEKLTNSTFSTLLNLVRSFEKSKQTRLENQLEY